MFKKVAILLILTFFVALGTVSAQTLKVNNQDVEPGQALNLFFDDLDAGRINFSVLERGLQKAEITFDRGRNWLNMEEENGVFTYRYRPLLDETISPEFILTIEGVGIRTYRPNVRVNYSRQKPDMAIEQVLERMKVFYESGSKDRFLNLFSHTYPERVKFEQAIQNDFFNYRNIRLFYRVNTRTFDRDMEGAIWNVSWQRKYEDRSGTPLADITADIAIRFTKEGGAWLISGLRNNTIFGSSLLACVDLKITSDDISGGYVGGEYTVSAVVHNISSVAANNFLVRFQSPEFNGEVSVDSIPANSQKIVSYNAAPWIPGGETVTVTVDSTNVLNECDRSNNTASRSFGF